MPVPKLIPLVQLVPPDRPMRFEMGDQAMDDLVESIKVAGILEPLLVVPWYQNSAGESCADPDTALGEHGQVPTRYEVRDGHRRFTAATMLELEEVPCMVFENSPQSKYLIMLHANVVREDVTPTEEGVLFLELATEYKWSMDDLVRHFRKSENYINDRVDLVQRDENVCKAVAMREIGLGQAKQILRVKDPVFRTYLLDQAQTHGANTRTLQQMITNKASEELAAQGELKMHTPELATKPEEPPVAVCIWCRSPESPEHLRVVQVHWFHQKDLEALVEQFGSHNLHKAVAGSTGTV